MTASIPVDILATWLSKEAINRINRIIAPERKARQVDHELLLIGLEAVWEDSEHGPVMMKVRTKPIPQEQVKLQ